MMYPIMVKIDFWKCPSSTGGLSNQFLLTLIIKLGLSSPSRCLELPHFFSAYYLKAFLPGTEILKDGTEVELYRSYISGAILLGIAPCTAMVLVWGFLAKGNQGLTLIMVGAKFIIDVGFLWVYWANGFLA